MTELGGKVAVVTGAANGIGFAMAERFLKEGMRVVIADVDEDSLAEAEKQLGADRSQLVAVQTDVSSAEAVDHLAQRTMEYFGSVYAICNNAGVNAYAFTSWEAPVATYEWVLGVNLWGVIHGIRSFVPLLVEAGEGHVINTSSAAAFTGVPYIAPYAATKHAVLGLSEALYFELAKEGHDVKVTVVCPAKNRTRIRRSARLWPDRLGAPAAVGAHQVEMDNLGNPEDAEDPSVVADQVWDAMQTGRFLVVGSVPNSIGALARRLVDVAGEPKAVVSRGTDAAAAANDRNA